MAHAAFKVKEGHRHACQDIRNYPPEQTIRLCVIYAGIIVKESWKNAIRQLTL
jgi:hypothetical protein